MTITEISLLERLQAENSFLLHENKYLKEQLAWFKRQIFGQRSERIVSDLNRQQLMLEGFENPEVPKEEEQETISAHKRRKPNCNGQDKITLPADLPVQTTILDIPEGQKICQETRESL
jgi:hypothetical protein